MLQLQQAGVLRLIGEGCRNRMWDLDSLLDLIIAPEAGEV